MVETLPIFTSDKLGSLTTKDGQSLDVFIGLNRDMVAQVQKHSLDVSDIDLQANTSDRKRFGEGSYEEWYGKERVPYALLDKEGRLAALAWFGPKPLGRKSLRYLSAEELAKENSQEKSDWHTIVYRSYPPYRGKGLMTPFMRQVISDYKGRYPGAKLWAGVSTRNASSVALATKLGFEVSEEYSDPAAHWCAMIEK